MVIHTSVGLLEPFYLGPERRNNFLSFHIAHSENSDLGISYSSSPRVYQSVQCFFSLRNAALMLRYGNESLEVILTQVEPFETHGLASGRSVN